MEQLRHFTQSCFLIEGGEKTIMVDPFKVAQRGLPQADILLITHPHFDHYSIEDIEAVSGEHTTIITSHDITEVPGKVKEHKTMHPGDTLSVDDINIEATHAYNEDKSYHPKENQWLGFIVSTPEKSYFFAGDCDRIPELKRARAVDYACVPISGTYVMNAEEAADAIIKDITPKKAIPCHFGEVVGSLDDAVRFVGYVTDEDIEAEVIKE